MKMEDISSHESVCACVYAQQCVPVYSGQSVWRWPPDYALPSAEGSFPHCPECRYWNHVLSEGERALVGCKMPTSGEQFAVRKEIALRHMIEKD